MEQLFLVAAGAASVAVGWFLYLVSKKGYAWGAAKLKAWWSAGKADLAGLESRLKSVEADIAALKTKVGA